MDDRQYLQSLIREGEHQQQDFKYRVSDALKLAKSVSAFANTDGGRLLIGVRDDGKPRAYIRIADENIVASPVHLAIWRESQNPQGTMLTYTDSVRKILDVLQDQKLPLNLIVRRSHILRPKVISLLARLIRFNVVHWEYRDQQFWFSL